MISDSIHDLGPIHRLVFPDISKLYKATGIEDIFPNSLVEIWTEERIKKLLAEMHLSESMLQCSTLLSCFEKLRAYPEIQKGMAIFAILHMYGGVGIHQDVSLQNAWCIPKKYLIAAFTSMPNYCEGQSNWLNIRPELLWSHPACSAHHAIEKKAHSDRYQVRQEWEQALKFLLKAVEEGGQSMMKTMPDLSIILGKSFAQIQLQSPEQEAGAEGWIGVTRCVGQRNLNSSSTNQKRIKYKSEKKYDTTTWISPDLSLIATS